MEKKFQDQLKNLPKELQPYKREIEATKKRYIPFTLKEAENISLTTSKVGGFPYLPLDAEYPMGKNDRKLNFLAQINFQEMPPLEGYPTHGILQFYVDYMLDYEYALDNNAKVIYYEKIENSHQDKFSALEEIREDMDYVSPFLEDVEFNIIFGLPEYESITNTDIRFTDILNFSNIDDDEEKDMLIDTYEETFGGEEKHKVGGYPDFTQDDPHDYDEYDSTNDYRELLFQLDSDDNNISWGDSGVGNYFIREKDLKKRDFSRVLFNWDCY